jgi:hypothetical protein
MESVDIAELALSLAEVDPDRPSPARIYDYWLGGSQNFAADRATGDRAVAAMPTLVGAVRANRAFLGRVVHHLVADLGVSQLLDLGSGVPTVGNVHEVARRADPAARVVYVDRDPVAIAHACDLLAEDDQTQAVLADLRRPEAVLAHPLLHSTLDFDRPIAVLMTAVLHFIPDVEDPMGLIRAYTGPTAPGSYLALTHAAPDLDHPEQQAAMLADYRRSTGVPFVNRAPERIAAWLADLEVQPPGLVPVDEWRPRPDAVLEPILRTYGVLARKPAP